MNTAIALQIQPGNLKSEFETAWSHADEKQVAKRLFEKDPSLWKTALEANKISARLDWLTLPENADELIAFSNQVKNEGFKFAVLLGMGGSSLCSEVARETFGSATGYPELLVLDNTAPSAILSIEKHIDIVHTLFIVASKSGGTLETLSFFNYFYEQLQKKGVDDTGNNFVAVTDAGTPLVAIAEQYKFKKTFINPSGIGGRYSVLSNFGLLPMALMGIDIKAMLASAAQMKTSCSVGLRSADNPGVSLGAALGAAQKQGRDKVTFVLSSSIHAFGYWVEQLLAESTGKEGKGLIPVVGETLGLPEVYQHDRVFVHMYIPSDDNSSALQQLTELEQAGHPVISIEVVDKTSLGGEYYRWEVATAIAGELIGINPFDEPNVAEGKKNTNDLIDEWRKTSTLKMPAMLFQTGDISVYGNADKEPPGTLAESLKDFLADFLDPAEPGNYIALLAYFEETEKRTEILQSLRMHLRDKLKVATTLGYGPRYLHSTGQLHKGGPGTGIYIILRGNESDDLPIPGEEFGFGTLHNAQSLGDFRSLNDKGRRVICIESGNNIVKGLEEILQSINDI